MMMFKSLLTLGLLSSSALAAPCPDLVGDYDCEMANSKAPAYSQKISRKGDLVMVDAGLFDIPVKPGQVFKISTKAGDAEVRSTCAENVMVVRVVMPNNEGGSITYIKTPTGFQSTSSEGVVRSCKRR